MKSKEVIAQVSIKLKILETLDFVSANKNKPVMLDAYFARLDKSTTAEDFVKIFEALEEKGFINPINAVTWRKIYDSCGVTFPEGLVRK